MFVATVYYKNGKSPWALTLTEPVSEAFEFPAFDGPQFFSEIFLEKLSPLNALRNYDDRRGKLLRVRKDESHTASPFR